MGIFNKSWFGAVLQGEKPVIVRATRGLAGKISHAEMSIPPDRNEKTAGCIGIQESLTIWLDTPFASKSKALKILPSMLDVQLPFPLEECCYCFAQFRKKSSRSFSVLAVASRRDAVRKRIGAYQAAGIDPVIIDHEGLALLGRSLAESPPQADSNRALISLEPGRLAIVIGSESYFVNAHSLQIPTEPDAATQADIANRIRRILRAELPPKKNTEWMFCGPKARQTEVVNSLYNLLKTEWPGPLTLHDSPEYFLPRALADRALAHDSCNLRRDELAHPALLAETRKHLTRSLFVFLLAGLMLIGFNLAWQAIASIQFSSAKKTIASLCGELCPGRTITYGREVLEIQPAIQKRLADFAPVLNAFNQPLSISLAGIINAGREADLNYTRLELSRDRILITGTADDWDYCDHLLKYVRALGYKAEIERQEAEDDDGVHFTLKGNNLENENRKSTPPADSPAAKKIKNSAEQP